VFDKGNINNYGAAYPDMIGDGTYAWSPPADVHLDALPKLLHHKYMIVDASLPDSDPLVETGSHNWSISANTKNDENTLILHSERIANLYLQEFAARYHESGGNGDLVTGVADLKSDGKKSPTTFALLQNYPNPFNGTTIIPVNVHQNTKSNVVHEIEIRNILGRIVRRIALYHLIVGLNKVEWDGKDSFGNSIVSGIYFYSLTGAGDKSIKMLYLK
ncbi:MAG: T9SS type A sorting domain-containing protein, partial [Actinobacteria bacterium]|nr:T9SS type A sorting domain-containing protein [Actinomycetota bacterium]